MFVLEDDKDGLFIIGFYMFIMMFIELKVLFDKL